MISAKKQQKKKQQQKNAHPHCPTFPHHPTFPLNASLDSAILVLSKAMDHYITWNHAVYDGPMEHVPLGNLQLPTQRFIAICVSDDRYKTK